MKVDGKLKKNQKIKELNMKICKKGVHNCRLLTDKEINGVKMADGTIDKSTIIGRKGDSVCIKCGKVFRIYTKK